MKFNRILMILAAVMLIATFAAGAKKQTVKISGLQFETKAEFSQPSKAGTDAFTIMHPKMAKPGSERFSVTVVLYTADAQKKMNMYDKELQQYTQTTYFGVKETGTLIAKTFFGKNNPGVKLEKKIPAPSVVEIFMLTLKNKDKVALCFQYNPSYTQDAYKIMAEIAASLKETK